MHRLRRAGELEPERLDQDPGGDQPRDPAQDRAAVELPSPFRTYLRYGALVCGPPAIDRAFETIDWCCSTAGGLDPRSRAPFFDAER